MTSHEYAKQLHELADKLEQAPEFKLPSYQDSFNRDYGLISFSYHSDKAPFLAAVKALGSGKKQPYGEYDLAFVAFDGLLHARINRDAVCRIVKPAQPAEYDCEPLLSQEEEAQIGA